MQLNLDHLKLHLNYWRRIVTKQLLMHKMYLASKLWTIDFVLLLGNMGTVVHVNVVGYRKVANNGRGHYYF